MPWVEKPDVLVVAIVPVRVAEMVPVRVAEMVPVRVAEMVPVLVAEIVPVLVAEIVPDFANAVVEKTTTKMPAKAMDFTFFIVCSWWFKSSGVTWSAQRVACQASPSSRPSTNN